MKNFFGKILLFIGVVLLFIQAIAVAGVIVMIVNGNEFMAHSDPVENIGKCIGLTIPAFVGCLSIWGFKRITKRRVSN